VPLQRASRLDAMTGTTFWKTNASAMVGSVPGTEPQSATASAPGSAPPAARPSSARNDATTWGR